MVWLKYLRDQPIWPSGIIPMGSADVFGPGEFPEEMGVLLQGLQHGLNLWPIALLVVVYQPGSSGTPSLVGSRRVACEV